MKNRKAHIAAQTGKPLIRLMPGSQEPVLAKTITNKNIFWKQHAQNAFYPTQTSLKDSEVHASSLNLMNPSLTKQNAYEVTPCIPHVEIEYSQNHMPMKH